MEEIVKHWQVIVSLAALLVYVVRVEVEVRHLKVQVAEAERRHIRCREGLDDREREVSEKLTKIEVMVARIDQRLTDFFNGKSMSPSGS